MLERFTDQARRVVVLAGEEARMLDHNWIGTEHLLLGVLREGDGVAARAHGIDPQDKPACIRTSQLPPGQDTPGDACAPSAPELLAYDHLFRPRFKFSLSSEPTSSGGIGTFRTGLRALGLGLPLAFGLSALLSGGCPAGPRGGRSPLI
jgi:hypothetical protein